MDPIQENTKLVNLEHVAQYMEMLFEDCDDPTHFVAFRGLGEKGTAQEGVFRDTHWAPADPLPAKEAQQHVWRWAQYHVASYIIPALVANHGQGSKDVLGFTAIVMDLDSGDAMAKLDHAEVHLGPATMVVASGGKTETGAHKRHAYWKLSEVEDDIEAVCLTRHRLAQLCGGDESFGVGRAHQPVRIPGSVHAKNGNATTCRIIEHRPERIYHFQDLEEAVEQMPPMPGLPAPSSDPYDFSGAPIEKPSADQAMRTTVHEGGEGANTRFANFSSVAGYWIRWHFEGKGTAEEALEATIGWTNSNMVPPWPLQRIQQEFNALYVKHRQKHDATQQAKSAMPGLNDQPNAPQGLLNWTAARTTQGDPPPRRFLVQGLVPAAVPQLVAAEGGAGKTFLMLDLALSLASHTADTPSTWLAEPVTDEASEGTVVFITAEDDLDEVHHRLADIDPTGRRIAAGDRFIVLPLPNVGGTFAFAHYNKEGIVEATPKWASLLEEMKRIHEQVSPIKAVILDPLASLLHGDENSSVIIQDFFRVTTGPICGDNGLGAALIVTHHIRKGAEIKGPEDMRDAVRGSGAVINGVRAALGFWQAHDYVKRMSKMKLEPRRGACYRAAVIKANNPEMLHGIKTLIRQPSGTLTDQSCDDKLDVMEADTPIKRAWLAFACKHAAIKGRPYTITSKTTGLYARHMDLPPALSDLNRDKLEAMAKGLREAGLLIEVKEKGGSLAKWLDVPGGDFDRGLNEIKEETYQPPDWSRYYFDQDIGQIWEAPF